MPKKEDKVLMYKEKPLLRKGNLLYYGNADDKYIICMQIENTEKLKDLELAGNVQVILQTNAAPGKEKVIKKAEREGLYAALDLGEFWLEDSLKNGV